MKLSDQPALCDFLKNQPAATIAVPIANDGTVHAASLLYWHTETPFALFFVTSRDSEKCTLLRERAAIPCAAVVGTELGTPFTLQMRGTLREVNPSDYPEQVKAYYKKRGNRHDDLNNPATCLLQFRPTWARFCDYSKGYTKHTLDVA